MNNELYNEKTLSAFLLGALSAEEQEALELALLENAQLQQQLQDAEYDLADDYVRGELSDEESAQFEQHFLQSSARRKLLVTAQALDEKRQKVVPEKSEEQAKIPNVIPFSAKPKPPKNFTWNYAWRLAASIAIISTFGFFAWKTWYKGSLTEQGLATLQQAWRHERPLESRLSGFGYAPFVQTRGAGDSPKNSILREQAGSELRRAMIETPNSSSQHALGTYYLHEQKFTEAIVQLEAALKAEPKNAQLHNDLGAALLELARQQKQTSERSEKSDPQAPGSLKTFAQANEHFAQALQINPQFAEAIFNQSLSLQELGLINQSIESWQKYLQLDSRSEWANEARRKLSELEELKKRTTYSRQQLWQDFLAGAEAKDDERMWNAFVRSREQSGNAITERLLDEYLALASNGQNVEATHKLDLLAHLGAIETTRGHDLFTAQLAQFYQRLSAAQRNSLTQARSLFKEARTQSRNNMTTGLSLYVQARQGFADAGSKSEAWLTDSLICQIHLRQSNHQAGRMLAQRLLNNSTTHRYQWLQISALSLLADLHANLNEYTDVINCSQQALALANVSQDIRFQLNMLQRLASASQSLGDYESALMWVRRSFALVRGCPTLPEEMWVTYNIAAVGLGKLQLLNTAIACEQEGLQLATQAERHLQMSRSFDALGEFYDQLHSFAQAKQQFEQSLVLGKSLSAEVIGLDIMAHALLRLGHLHYDAHAFSAALQYYEESIRISDQLNIVDENLAAHRGKLKIHLALNDDSAVKRELQVSLPLLEKNRENIVDEQLRNTYFAAEQDVYELAIQFAATRDHDAEQAFNYAEQRHARSLLASLPSHSSAIAGTTQPLPLVKIKKQIAGSAQIIQYAVLNEMLVIWVISDSAFYSEISHVRLTDLETKVESYLAHLTNGQGDDKKLAEREAQELYDWLMRPIASALDEQKELCIVPDGILNYLPFAALIEHSSGKYLIEKYAIAYAPSTTVFLSLTQALEKKKLSTASRCLSVGNPAFDQQRFPQLRELASTQIEAEKVADHYLHTRLLLAGKARESTVRAEFPKAEIIHFASHGLVDEKQPQHSSLVLARESAAANESSDGLLCAEEISRMKLPNTQLVVLSACQTGLGKNYRGEGMVGLVQAFLVAGALQVVASLWLVNSETTRKLMPIFHRYLTQSSLSTAQALRQAQIDMLRNSDPYYAHPAAWAAFAVIGGQATR